MARAIDADAFREWWLENGENEYVYDTNSFLASIDDAPTINPESLPIVRHLREQVQNLQKELIDWDFWYGPVREQEAKMLRENRAAVKVMRKRCEKTIADLRAELAKVMAERDAVIKELNGVSSLVDDLAEFVDREIHPVVDYNLYLDLRENVDAVSMFQHEDEWRGLHKEE